MNPDIQIYYSTFLKTTCNYLQTLLGNNIPDKTYPIAQLETIILHGLAHDDLFFFHFKLGKKKFIFIFSFTYGFRRQLQFLTAVG